MVLPMIGWMRKTFSCLIGAIDDTTSKLPEAFFEQAESFGLNFRLFSAIFVKHGLPPVKLLRSSLDLLDRRTLAIKLNIDFSV